MDGLELSCELAKQMLSQLRYTPTKETVFVLKHFSVDRISVHSLETVKHRKCRSYCVFDSFSLLYPALAGRAYFWRAYGISSSRSRAFPLRNQGRSMRCM